MFNRKGVIEYDAEVVSEDAVLEAGLEAGADDIVNEDGIITVTTDTANFAPVLEALQGKGFESISAEVSMVPDAYTTLDAETTRKVLKLTDRLEEDDDVQNVYTNMDIPEDFEEE
jgi:transcriptional/translational regulatory protein YebC/TACO1